MKSFTAALLGVRLVRGYELSCQLPTRYVRISHVVDVAGSNPYFSTVGDAMEDFDAWMKDEFTLGAPTSLFSFSSKGEFGSLADYCSAVNRPLTDDDNLVAEYDALQRPLGSPSSRSVLDAMWSAAKQDWNSPINAGRQFIVVYAAGPPQLPSEDDGLVPWTPGCDCEVCDAPTPADLGAEFNLGYQFVIFVVPASLGLEYEALLGAMGVNGLVVPAVVGDKDAMFQGLGAAFDFAYCGVDPPTYVPTSTEPLTTPTPTPTVDPTPPTEGPQASTLEPITGATPPESTVEPPTTASELPMTTEAECMDGAFLQLLHLQDMSWSYTNDLDTMRNKYPDLVASIESHFGSYELGLASFVDKPVPDVGYSYDYCYRDEVGGFTTDMMAYKDAMLSLEHKSGRDWKESQYDAMYDGLKSPAMQWLDADMVDGKYVVRVIILATDAGPHEAGHTSLPTDLTAPCAERDYPAPADVAAALAEKKVVPIFVVNGDIENYWRGKAGALVDQPRVIELTQPTEKLFAEIMAILEELCAVAAASIPQGSS